MSYLQVPGSPTASPKRSRAMRPSLPGPLPSITFHSEPLMNGHKEYGFLGIEQRKVMLAYFSSFVRKLPISYITFVYRRSQFENPARLMERMGRDISSAMIEPWASSSTSTM